MTPSDELRQAAQHIRDLAGNCTPAPWTQEHDRSHIIHGPDYTVAEAVLLTHDARHIDLWDPAVAELVADLLDHAADVIAQYPPEHHPAADPWMPLARAINAKATVDGGQS